MPGTEGRQLTKLERMNEIHLAINTIQELAAATLDDRASLPTTGL